VRRPGNSNLTQEAILPNEKLREVLSDCETPLQPFCCEKYLEENRKLCPGSLVS
jgi:hypothetical protein